jgi:hypothetical protein
MFNPMKATQSRIVLLEIGSATAALNLATTRVLVL